MNNIFKVIHCAGGCRASDVEEAWSRTCHRTRLWTQTARGEGARLAATCFVQKLQMYVYY